MDNKFHQKLSELNKVFSPSAPIISKNLFFGRLEQISKISEAINERGQHAVLFGERGVGKTSLANIISDIISELLSGSSLIVEKTNCNRTDTFKSIWEKILRKIYLTIQQSGLGFKAENKKHGYDFSQFLPQKGELTTTDVSQVLKQFSKNTLLIFDEYDTVRDTNIKSQFADLIKDLSDNNPFVTILLVGIGDNISQLIGEHQSVERCLKQIKMPRMSKKELEEIIDNGLKTLEMEIEEEVKNKIINFSFGFPHYTHLLSKFAAKTALQNKSLKVTQDYFDYAINEAIDNANESIKEAYQGAIVTSKKESKFEDVVAACALAKEDNNGNFRTLDVVEAYNKLTGKNIIPQAIIYNLGKLCKEERGEIIEKVGKGKQIKFRFKNPLINAYVKIKLYQEKKIN